MMKVALESQVKMIVTYLSGFFGLFLKSFNLFPIFCTGDFQIIHITFHLLLVTKKTKFEYQRRTKFIKSIKELICLANLMTELILVTSWLPSIRCPTSVTTIYAF